MKVLFLVVVMLTVAAAISPADFRFPKKKGKGGKPVVEETTDRGPTTVECLQLACALGEAGLMTGFAYGDLGVIELKNDYGVDIHLTFAPPSVGSADLHMTYRPTEFKAQDANRRMKMRVSNHLLSWDDSVTPPKIPDSKKDKKKETNPKGKPVDWDYEIHMEALLKKVDAAAGAYKGWGETTAAQFTTRCKKHFVKETDHTSYGMWDQLIKKFPTK